MFRQIKNIVTTVMQVIALLPTVQSAVLPAGTPESATVFSV